MRAGIMKEIVRSLGIDTRAQLLAERLWQHIEEPSRGVVGAFYRDLKRSTADILLDEQKLEPSLRTQKEHLTFELFVVAHRLGNVIASEIFKPSQI
jgi:hypothetical protein